MQNQAQSKAERIQSKGDHYKGKSDRHQNKGDHFQGKSGSFKGSFGKSFHYRLTAQDPPVVRKFEIEDEPEDTGAKKPYIGFGFPMNKGNRDKDEKKNYQSDWNYQGKGITVRRHRGRFPLWG